MLNESGLSLICNRLQSNEDHATPRHSRPHPGHPHLDRYDTARLVDTLVEDASADGRIAGLFDNFSASTPWLFLDIDREKAVSIGVSMQDIIDTLQIQLGSYYVNNFSRFGRSWQVKVMADAGFRSTEIGRAHV